MSQVTYSQTMINNAVAAGYGYEDQPGADVTGFVYDVAYDLVDQVDGAHDATAYDVLALARQALTEAHGEIAAAAHHLAWLIGC